MAKSPRPSRKPSPAKRPAATGGGTQPSHRANSPVIGVPGDGDIPPTIPAAPSRNTKNQPSGRRSLSIALGLLVGAVFLTMVWQYLNLPAPVEKVEPTIAAGQPLDTSSATINVLTPPAEPTEPFGQVSITVLPPQPALVPAKPTPSLALLLPVVEQAYAQGGPTARRMANLGAEQASNHPTAQEAYVALRNATPENGPITPAVLLIEIGRVLALPAPAVSATTVIVASTTSDTSLSGWFRTQLQRFVTLRPVTAQHTGPATDAWHAALGTAQHHIARNNAAEAELLLGQPPLATDARLDVLRHLLAEYTDLQTRLNAVREATLPLITGGAE